MEESFNEKQSLELIAGMINKAKNKFTESGTLYLVWGIVVLVCSLGQFVLLHYFNYKQSYYVWLLLLFVWVCFILCLNVIIFKLIYSRRFELIYSAILVLHAIPIFLSGAILKVNLLIIGGVCCWVLACISLLFH